MLSHLSLSATNQFPFVSSHLKLSAANMALTLASPLTLAACAFNISCSKNGRKMHFVFLVAFLTTMSAMKFGYGNPGNWLQAMTSPTTASPSYRPMASHRSSKPLSVRAITRQV